jgi:hypothetical protein
MEIAFEILKIAAVGVTVAFAAVFAGGVFVFGWLMNQFSSQFKPQLRER